MSASRNVVLRGKQPDKGTIPNEANCCCGPGDLPWEGSDAPRRSWVVDPTRVSFSGDDEFPLLGGSVGYLLDRKVAVFVFKCRLHTISLLVFPSTRLRWPTSRSLRLGTADGATSRAGGLDAIEQEWRGFNVLAWKRADLGFALVSDVNCADLVKLATRIVEP